MCYRNAACTRMLMYVSMHINLSSSFEQSIYLLAHVCLVSHSNCTDLVRDHTAEGKVGNETVKIEIILEWSLLEHLALGRKRHK